MIEKYAFITNNNYDTHGRALWPHAISVGDNYKMVQYASINQEQLNAWVESLGFESKYLNAADTITAMEANEPGPFNCNHSTAIEVVEYFTPALEGP